VVRYLTVVKATFNNAKRLGSISDNPTIRVKLPKVDNILVRYLSPDQEQKLLDHLPEKFQPVVRFAVHTGCRQGELLRLEWADFNQDLGVLTVRETKAGDTRRVPLNSVSQGILAELRGRSNPKTGDRIFPLEARYLRRAFEKAVKAAGVGPFRFHDTRHVFASRLTMTGANDRTIMALGGWKSPAMLSRYAHLSPTHLWQSVEALTKFGTGVKTGGGPETEKVEDAQRIEKYGEPRATRTLGPRLKRAMLYQLS